MAALLRRPQQGAPPECHLTGVLSHPPGQLYPEPHYRAPGGLGGFRVAPPPQGITGNFKQTNTQCNQQLKTGKTLSKLTRH